MILQFILKSSQHTVLYDPLFEDKGFLKEIWATGLVCVTRVCLPESDALVVDVGFADDF